MEAGDFILYAGGVAILVLAGFISYLIYAMTKVVQSTNVTVDDINKKLEKVDPVFDETTKTLTDLNQSVQSINENMLKPIASIASVFKGVRQAMASFKEGQAIFSGNKDSDSK